MVSRGAVCPPPRHPLATPLYHISPQKWVVDADTQMPAYLNCNDTQEYIFAPVVD